MAGLVSDQSEHPEWQVLCVRESLWSSQEWGETFGHLALFLVHTEVTKPAPEDTLAAPLVGTRVEIVGLTSQLGQTMNGQQGVVAPGNAATGRVGVLLNGTTVSKAIRLSNVLVLPKRTCRQMIGIKGGNAYSVYGGRKTPNYVHIYRETMDKACTAFNLPASNAPGAFNDGELINLFMFASFFPAREIVKHKGKALGAVFPYDPASWKCWSLPAALCVHKTSEYWMDGCLMHEMFDIFHQDPVVTDGGGVGSAADATRGSNGGGGGSKAPAGGKQKQKQKIAIELKTGAGSKVNKYYWPHVLKGHRYEGLEDYFASQRY